MYDGTFYEVGPYGYFTGLTMRFAGLNAMKDGESMTIKLTKHGQGYGSRITSEKVEG